MILRKLDAGILISAMLLIFMGVMMVYSASAIEAAQKLKDEYYFMKKTFIFAPLAIVLIFVIARIDYQRYIKIVYPLFFITILLMALVFVPGLGVEKKGAMRWLSIAGFSFQPSELTKLCLLIFMAYSLAKKREKMQSFKIGVLPNLLIAGILMVLVLKQRDLGTTSTLGMVFLILLFVGGTRLSYLAGFLLTSIPILYFLIFSEPYRRSRIMAFLNPWEHRQDAGFQIIQSYMGFYNGSLWGVGLGQGRQKMGYLPESHTDFILPVIAEELGLIGVLFVLTLFAILIWRGFRTALRAPDLFGMYLALGITALIGLQTMINCGVVMGLLPTKGLPLPFISYGGTSLLVMGVFIGILLNIASKTSDIKARRA